jgi:hypothetical protein
MIRDDLSDGLIHLTRGEQIEEADDRFLKIMASQSLLGSDVCVYGEVGQERFDLGFGGEEVLTGPHAVETNKPHDPVHVGSLGVNGVVVQTEYLSDLIEEFWLLTFCRVRHIRLP